MEDSEATRGWPGSATTVRRIVVLGAGFGGLELTARISDALGDDVEVVLIDRTDCFVFGYSKLDVMFGHSEPTAVQHPYRNLVKPGVRFVQATIESIDPVERRVETDAGTFDADVLVVALGADLHPEATPGLLEGGYEFYSESGAFALRSVLAEFGGGRVVVGVTSIPYKCPPAPSETTLLVHELLVHRGVRESSSISLVMPLPVPVPPSPSASTALLDAFTERDIDFVADSSVQALDPARNVAMLSSGSELPYDLFLGVPAHRAPAVVQASPLAVNGWIPVDPLTLETRFPDVYAVGDVTSVGTPKAGVFAEGQAAVVADHIIARVRHGTNASTYGGNGICYVEFGDHNVAKIDITFRAGERPTGDLEGPSSELHADKVEFGRDRIERWFDRPWPDADPAGR